MRRNLTVTLLVGLVTVWSVGAIAEPHVSVAPPKYEDVAAKGPQALLEMADRIHFGYGSQWVDTDLIVHAADGTVEKRAHLVMHEQGERRLIRLTAPAEVKGMGILVKDRDTMYVYVPEFDKVRRVASHARKQTFLGSDFNYDDMAMASLAPDYVATIDSETADEVVLQLKVRPERKEAVVYPALKVTISKKTCQMSKQEYYDAEGRLIRTQERSNMRTWESPDYAVQSHIKMIDHDRKGHWSELIFTGYKARHDIPDRIFRKRTLVRGE